MPAAQRIAVDEDGAPPVPRRSDGERAGQRGCSGPAPAADHADGERGPADALGHVGDPVDEPALGVGQPQHVVGADLDRPPPHLRVVLVPADEHHTPSAARPRARARTASSPTSTSGARLPASPPLRAPP